MKKLFAAGPIPGGAEVEVDHATGWVSVVEHPNPAPGCTHLDSYEYAAPSQTTSYETRFRCRDCEEILVTGTLLESWSVEILALKLELKRLSEIHHPCAYHFVKDHK